MMQELVDLQTTLFNVGVDAKSIYDLKLEIIRRNLYGADIDGFAVNIALLRLWLSLVIEYEGDRPEPLPNLEFKIARGDSLLAPDPNPQSYGDLFGDFIRQLDLDRLKAEHMRTTEQAEKDRLKAEIEDSRRQIREMLGDAAGDDVIDWRVEFAEVMGAGGFDIVIANPPYIQLQRDQGRLGQLYKDVGYLTFIRSGDIYQLFYERGCQILKPSTGLLAYITSNSWLKAEYGKRTRRYFSEQHSPLTLLELGKDVFESAIVDSNVVLVRSGRKALETPVFDAVDVERMDADDFPPPKRRWGQVRVDGELPWSILSQTEQGIIDKMRAVGTPLKEWDIAIYRGITTGLNDAFIIDNQTKEALVAEDPKSAEIIKPVLRGRDIERYRAKWAGMWLIDTHNGHDGVPPVEVGDYPAITTYLNEYYDRLANRYDKGRTPYNLRNCAYHAEFTKEKLFWIDLTEQGRFAYDASEVFCVNSAYMMTGDSIKYLCAVLNSDLTTWFMRNSALNSGMGTTRWVRFTVERIPVPIIDAVQERPFTRLVDEILQVRDAGADTTDLEADIDRLVCDLYRLSEDEVQAITKT